MCKHVYVYVCMDVRMYVCVYVYGVCGYECVTVRTYMRMRIWLCACMCECMYVCMYVYLYVCMYVCT